MSPKGRRQHGDPGNRWMPYWQYGGAAYAPVRGGGHASGSNGGPSRAERLAPHAPTSSKGWACNLCQRFNSPWSKGCATCWAKAPTASVAPWYRGKKEATVEAEYKPPDPQKDNAAERRTIAEQLRATKSALASLQRLGVDAFPKAQAALQKQLAALADQRARAMQPRERLQAAKDALASAARQREALEEKAATAVQRIAALEEALRKASAEQEQAEAKLVAIRSKCEDLAKLVQLETEEQPSGPPQRVDPVETALAMAVSSVSQKSPIIMRYLPQLLQAVRTLRVPSAAEADADPLWEDVPNSEPSDLDESDGEDDDFADQLDGAAPPGPAGSRSEHGPGGGTRRPPRRAEEPMPRVERSRSPKDL